MWTHRRVTWHLTEVATDQAKDLADQVTQVMKDQMVKTPQFFHQGWMNGSALGMLEFGLVISDRDQWWVGRRARMLTDELRKHTDLPLALVSMQMVKPPPHPNRGKYRLRRMRKANSG